MTEIKYEDVKKLIEDEKALIIDVRSPSEIEETGSIPGSINIPNGTVEQTLQLSDAEFLEKYRKPLPAVDQELVFYCKMGGRAAKSGGDAEKIGFKNVKVYKGSYTDWAANEGLPAP